MEFSKENDKGQRERERKKVKKIMIFLNKTQLEKKTEKKRIMYTKISKWFDSDTFNLICVCIAWQNGEKKCNNLS